jgi:hypothetical protein
MKRIKKFDEFTRSSVVEKDEDTGLLRDLENIGMKERTYTKEMFRDAMNNVRFDSHLRADVSGDEYEMDLDHSSGDSTGTVRAGYVGGVYTQFDQGTLWGDIKSEVESLDMDDYEDDGEERYTLDDLESAFDSVDWEDIENDAAEDLYGDVELDIDGSDQGEGRLDVEVEATIDPDVAEVADEEVIDLILDNL